MPSHRGRKTSWKSCRILRLNHNHITSSLEDTRWSEASSVCAVTGHIMTRMTYVVLSHRRSNACPSFLLTVPNRYSSRDSPYYPKVGTVPWVPGRDSILLSLINKVLLLSIKYDTYLCTSQYLAKQSKEGKTSCSLKWSPPIIANIIPL